jgi:hypothetical protein
MASIPRASDAPPTAGVEVVLVSPSVEVAPLVPAANPFSRTQVEHCACALDTMLGIQRTVKTSTAKNFRLMTLSLLLIKIVELDLTGLH